MRKTKTEIAAFALTMAVFVAVSACEARELKPSYGECTFGCDITYRRCIKETGKIDGGAKCASEQSACRARCSELKPDHDKPVKPTGR
jgi:hypothetical protein